MLYGIEGLKYRLGNNNPVFFVFITDLIICLSSQWCPNPVLNTPKVEISMKIKTTSAKGIFLLIVL